MNELAGVTMVLTLLALLLGALWFFLPFAVFGTKPKIDAAIAEARRANTQLEAMVAEQAATRQAIEALSATMREGSTRSRSWPQPPPVPTA
jgi:hypothetical protein